MIAKTKQLSTKKKEKFQQLLKACKDSLEKGLVGLALEQAKDLICNHIHLHEKTLDVSAFRGLGNVESWLQQFPKGPLSWYQAACQKSQIDNPFDLFNICNMIQLHLRKKEAKDIKKEYLEMIP